MLKEEGKIGDDLANRLMGWRHSGFSVHNRVRVRRDDDGGREDMTQYIIRNTFSVEKLTYIKETATVIYRSKMTHGNTNKKNFQVYTPAEFIAAITQHIPEKSFQMVRFYGWYSNKSIRKKQGPERSAHDPEADKDMEDPPIRETSRENGQIVYEPFDDGWPDYEEPSIMVNLC